MKTQAEDGFLQGLENDQDGLEAIHKFGFLRACDVGLFLWGNDENSQKYGQRICRKWVKKEYVIKRELPSKAGGAYVLATAGVRFLEEKGIKAKSGKDWGIMKERKWSPPREWKHHVIANGFLALKCANGHAVFSENELRQEGQKGKLPDGIYTTEFSAFWIEVENQRKTGPNMISMVQNVIKLSTKEYKFNGKGIIPVIVYCENSTDERGFAINHKERVINAIKSNAKIDISLRFAKLEMNGLSITNIEEDILLIEADEISAELKRMERDRIEREKFKKEETQNYYVYYINEKERHTINKKDFSVNCGDVKIGKFLSMLKAKRFLATRQIESRG